MLQSTSDEQLMLEYAAGDASAFETLYQRHRAALYRYMKRHVNPAETANELYQDVWERVIKARDRYHPQAKFSTWLYRIAHNRIIDFYRIQKTTTELPEHLSTEDDEAYTQYDHAQQQRALLKAIDQLPFEQRDVLLLKLEQGLDLQQIAQVTGVKPETAKSRLRYAVKKLHKVLS